MPTLLWIRASGILNFDLFPSHVVAHRFRALGALLAHDNFFGNVRRLAHHGLFPGLMHFDGALLECPCRDASFAGRDWARRSTLTVSSRKETSSWPGLRIRENTECTETVRAPLFGGMFVSIARPMLFYLSRHASA